MDELIHYGTPRHSGRYPWGSGKNPQRNKNFRSRVKELKKQGLTEKQIAESFGYSVTQLRAQMSIAKNEQDKERLAEALKLKDKGYSQVAIAKKLGTNESNVRYMLKEGRQQRIDSATLLSETLKKQLEDHPYLDVGKGVELQLNVSSTQLKTALAMLDGNGYSVHSFDLPQVSDPSHKTPMLVLTKDDIDYKNVRQNQEKISAPEGVHFENYGEELVKHAKPISFDSKRLKVIYDEDGGGDKDGLIELRPGVPEISLGDSKYAQVRIAVDGTHYLKGMAVYSNNLPDGIDIQFNTSKTKDVPVMGPDKDNSVLKPFKKDPSSPFGTVTRPGYDSEGNQNCLNIVNDDEDWGKWSKNLASQFLSKQPVGLAKRQLDIAYKQREQQYDEIMAYTNPTIKRKLLTEFADECDSAAVHLKAAALPRQATYVILPVTSLKPNEVYAPGYSNGEEVVLIRYPHAGRFEIPRLTVNNNNKEAREVLGNAKHAIGINSVAAKQLSGADFDGDTVVLIPTRGQKIETSKPLKELRDFNPCEQYKAYPGMKRVGEGDGFHHGTEMGKVSNLITDMTIGGATEKEIARAVKHSMVVVDAEKHNLDWKRSYSDNGIAELKEKYQGGKNAGASTLISKAKSPATIDERKQVYKNGGIDPVTGKKLYENTGREYESPRGSGKYKKATTTITKMEKAEDAYELSSGSVIENVYAAHANRLKALANKARKSFLETPKLQREPSAAKTYAPEVTSLFAKLRLAQENAPRERQAQLIANKIVSTKIQDNPELKNDKDALKKERARAINYAREKAKTNRYKIDITDREWEAIQAGAISDSRLSEILKYSDPDKIKKRATPKRSSSGLSSATLSRARSLLKYGYTQAEVAEEFGISVSTLEKALEKGG